ncbi:MAG: hypothetical protein AABX39_04420 [Nanoarchaeota archaeon]
MTTRHVHLAKIREHLRELRDAIAQGIEESPATIGFHTSACSIDFLELYLHKKNKLEIGAQIKHEWFKRPKKEQRIIPLFERKLKIDFPNKERVVDLIYSLEEKRNKLIYGSSTKLEIEQVLHVFENLKELFIKMLKEEGEEIEE